MNIVIDAIINPEGVQPMGDDQDRYFDQSIASNVPDLLRSIAVIQMVFGLFTILFCFKKKEEKSIVINNTHQCLINQNQNHEAIKDNFNRHKNQVQLNKVDHNNSSTKSTMNISDSFNKNAILFKCMCHKSFYIPVINNICTHGTGILMGGM